MLAGRVTVAPRGQTWRDIGERQQRVRRRGALRGVPAGGARRRRSARSTEAEIGVASAPGGGRAPARLIEPASMKRFVARQGRQHALRAATSCRRPSRPSTCWSSRCARRAGHSSSYPPHKHDTDDAAGRKLARGDLLPPPRSRAGLRVPARLHRRPLARRIARRRGPRRRDGAARLSPGRRAVRLRVVLPERDGGTDSANGTSRTIPAHEWMLKR